MKFTEPLKFWDIYKFHTSLPIAHDRLEDPGLFLPLYTMSRGQHQSHLSALISTTAVSVVQIVFFIPIPKFSGPMTALSLDSLQSNAWHSNFLQNE